MKGILLLRMQFPEASLVSEQGALVGQEAGHFPRTSQPDSLRLCALTFHLNIPSYASGRRMHCSLLLRSVWWLLVVGYTGKLMATPWPWPSFPISHWALSVSWSLCAGYCDALWALLIHLSSKADRPPQLPGTLNKNQCNFMSPSYNAAL